MITCFTPISRTPPSRALSATKTCLLHYHIMAPPHHAEKIQKEGRVTLAVNSIQKNQISSYRTAATVYEIPLSTLRDRLHGRSPKLGSRCKSRLLSESEEAVLISWIRSIERRGFLPFIIDVHRMVQSLIDSRGLKSPKPIGKN